MWGDASWGDIAWGDLDASPTWPSAGSVQNALFLDALLSDEATLSTVQTAAVSVDNLQDKYPSKKWRSTALADGILMDLPYAYAINAVAANGHNIDVWRMRGFATSADRTARTPAVADSNYASPWPLAVKPADPDWLNYPSLLKFTNEAPAQYWLLEVFCTEGGITAAEMGRLAAGRYFQPTRNITWESPTTYEPADMQAESDYGALDSEERFNPKVFDLNFEDMEATDLRRAAELHRRLGKARDLFCFIEPAATGIDFHRQAIHGLLTAGGKHVPIRGWGDDGGYLTQTGFRIKELLF